MKKFLLPLSVLLLLSASCRKNETTWFTGKVYDANTGAVLPNAHLQVTALFHYQQGGSEQNRGVGTGDADANGNFAIELSDRDRNKEKDKQYSVTVTSSGTWNYTGGDEFNVVYQEGSVHHDVAVNGIGRMHIIAKNTSPYDQNDVIGNFYLTQAGDIYQAPTYNGVAVNDTFLIQGFSGMKILHYTVVKNTVTAQYTDTLHVPGFAEGYYEIDY